ncbi:MAG: MBL fold metallo-hydrolase [Spirochaetes bacterium]|jgi:glyoxylase-like metal-dependent hydrolase (beta-lactamase superfamily II)|nr:MBL fold metallo-hydrolase [Spirochaetota bacterium]
MKITEGIYGYIWKGIFENNCNSFYFGEPFNILFDPGLKNYTDMLLKQMRDDGLDADKIAYVINTHSHPDHFEGTVNFTSKGIPAGMHKEEIIFLKQLGPLFFQMMGMQFPDLKFDIELEEGLWHIGEHSLEIYKTPGHSPASVCIYWKEKKTLVCGDLVFNSSFGRVDFPGGNAKLLKESIDRISQLDIEYLLPGHMDIVAGKNNVIKNFEVIKQYLEFI